MMDGSTVIAYWSLWSLFALIALGVLMAAWAWRTGD